jgi:hypothetical protein
MLEKLGKWYRIVTSEPSHEVLEKRKKSIGTIVSVLSKKRKELIPEAVSGLVYRFESRMNATSTIVDKIHKQDLAFPTDVEENDVELKVMAAVALGEVLRNQRAKLPRRLAATCIVSALGIPRDIHSKTLHLTEMLEDIRAMAIQVLQKEAVAIRNISSPTSSIDISARFDEMNQSIQDRPELNQAPALWQVVSPVLKQMMNDFNRQFAALEHTQRVDREELETLWWSYTGWSKTTREPFASMNIGAAAFHAGRELADICIVPPSLSTQYLLEDIVSRGRKSASQELPLEKMMSEWSESVMTDDRQDDLGVSSEIAKMCPAVMPISWIVQRMIESRMSARWTDEFETMTGIKKDIALSPGQWARQVLWEHIVQKVYGT